MKYAGSIIIIDNLSSTVYERELTADEIIETLLKKPTEVESETDITPDSPLRDVRLFPTRKNKAESKSKPRPAVNGEKSDKAKRRDRVIEMLKDGESHISIQEATGANYGVIAYQAEKLGMSLKRAAPKQRIPGRMKKAEPAGPEPEYYPITNSDDIERIWGWVDDGVREAGAIAKRCGLVEKAVHDVLMAPRP